MDKQNSKVTIDYGEMTHPGGRKENEDYLSAALDAEGDSYCFIIADGMGGHSGGRNASQLAVESIISSYTHIDRDNPGKWLYEAFQEAHNSIKWAGKADASVRNMRTTCVAMVILGGKAYWASVGDSRIYIMRDGTVLQKSKDHSVVQVLLDMGEIKPEDVPGHPDRNRVLRTLGMDEDMKPTVSSEGLLLQRGDTILLCTDGFWEYVTDSTIAEFFHEHSNLQAQWLLDELCNRIIRIARMNNERHDNLSAQLIVVR
jgi:serine/threonine protein phosphatase PrpC